MRVFLLLFAMIVTSLPTLMAQESDCRLKVSDLKPYIQRLNPFFADHTWDQSGQIEMARMGADRLVVITQDGCKRHHTRFTLLIQPLATKDERDFWISETENFIHKIYWGNPEYHTFSMDFNKLLEEKFDMYGLGNPFNFPLGSRNFIVEIINNDENGGKIMVEMVTFIFKEKVQPKKSGIPSKEDDGWKQ